MTRWPTDDRLYFRQLLSGRDFAVGDPIAQQMVNFVYAIGDRATGECVLVDPAYAVDDLVDVVEADGMSVTGVLATHYHPDHVGGSMMGYSIEGVAALLERVDCPIHVQRDEVPWVPSTTGVADEQLVAHDAGDVVTVGDVDDRRSSTRPATRRAASASSSTAGWSVRRHPVPRRLRPHRPARQRPGADVRQPAAPGHAARRHDRVPRPPLLAAVERLDGGDPRAELRVPAALQGAVADDVRPLTTAALIGAP